MKTPTRTLAVIGFGPRGLGALEALAIEAMKRNIRFKIDIFDTLDVLGAGPNFHPEEDSLCILNIPVRILDIDPPACMSDHIAPFAEWSATDYGGDDFPPRADLGAYLEARFAALRDTARDVFNVTHIKAKARALSRDDGWHVTTKDQHYGPYDEVLLSPGQPATKLDPQMKEWTDHAQDHKLDLLHAYPGAKLLAAAHDWQDKTVAIRGLGLSTHDVLRLLTIGLGGRFERGAYTRSGREPRKILPFSRDGLPPAPKPATAEIDRLFDPTRGEIEAFKAALTQAVGQDPDDALKTICAALVPPAMRILAECDAAQSRPAVEQWLATERDDPGAQDIQDTIATLRVTIDMAHQRIAPSIGYVIGQIWRKMQNDLRSGVNGAVVAPDTAIAIVGFDGALKRYSYGPPVTASEQLLTLIDDGLVSLQAVEDPDILMEPDGWRLVEEDAALLAPVMIDAVLPNPSLENITAPLFKRAMDEGSITAVAEGFGAQTRPDGSLVDRNGTVQNGLSLLGRLSLGSVIATDSLHDCFGASTHRWAAGVIDRST
ncbi:FAD/NAD(P)-binding protein [Gymnodinialimonas sp. 57CJ19]|uniref:FAD/NAD(P)-binding protein n=1 Tax=Gymnodinialimonas sp. 57CJ19 TaxID=3138498 RepID=UPI00313455A3